MLRLLECYTLRAIDHLEAKDEETMTAMAPNLRSTFKVEGAWH